MLITEHYLRRVAEIESGGNPEAKAPTSSALGLFQFTDGTWRSVMRTHPELNLTLDGRTDPGQATRAFIAFSEDNATIFRHAFERDPTEAELYLCHFLGVGNVLRVLRVPAATHLRDVPEFRAAMHANPFMRDFTSMQLRMWSEKKLNPALPDAHPAPAPAHPAQASAPKPKPKVRPRPQPSAGELDRIERERTEELNRLELERIERNRREVEGG